MRVAFCDMAQKRWKSVAYRRHFLLNSVGYKQHFLSNSVGYNQHYCMAVRRDYIIKAI